MLLLFRIKTAHSLNSYKSTLAMNSNTAEVKGRADCSSCNEHKMREDGGNKDDHLKTQ
jgi:hypothetical protein